MKLTKKQFKQIKGYFAKQPDIVAVYLYGSFTKGTTNKRSDIDFGILFDKPIKDLKRVGEIYSGLPKLGVELDVRDISLDYPPVYLLNVIQGQLIYSRSEKEKINFEVEVMKRFYDTQHLRNVRLSYMRKRLQEGMYGY